MGVIAVILCGGCGSRLAPLSSVDRPKQFIKMFNGQSLFQMTLLRTIAVKGLRKVIVITTKKYSVLVTKDIQELVVLKGDKFDIDIIFEHSAQNTTVSIAFVIAYITCILDRDRALFRDSIVLFLPSDHYFFLEQFLAFIQKAIKNIVQSYSNNILLFGAHAKSQSLGKHFGYIFCLKDKVISSHHGVGGVLPIDKFVEKPSSSVIRSNSQMYFAYWNLGIYIAKIQVIMDLLRTNVPKLFKQSVLLMEGIANTEAVNRKNILDLGQSSLIQDRVYDSFDKTITESCRNSVFFPIKEDLFWYDLGNWSTLYRFIRKTL